MVLQPIILYKIFIIDDYRYSNEDPSLLSQDFNL